PLAGTEALRQRIEEQVAKLASQGGVAGDDEALGPDLSMLEAAMEALVELGEELASREQQGAEAAPETRATPAAMTTLVDCAAALAQPLLVQLAGALQAAVENHPAAPKAGFLECARAALD